MEYINNEKAKLVWTQNVWEEKHFEAKKKVLEFPNDSANIDHASRWGKVILKKFSSSFYTVTRLLPEKKKKDVQIIYAAVMYPEKVGAEENPSKPQTPHKF